MNVANLWMMESRLKGLCLFKSHDILELFSPAFQLLNARKERKLGGIYGEALELASNCRGFKALRVDVGSKEGDEIIVLSFLADDGGSGG